MPDGSEFQTAGAATLKPQQAKVVRTRGADNRLVFAASADRVWECGNYSLHKLFYVIHYSIAQITNQFKFKQTRTQTVCTEYNPVAIANEFTHQKYV